MTRALATAGARALPALLDSLQGGYPAAHQLAVELLRCAFLPAADQHQGGDGVDTMGPDGHTQQRGRTGQPEGAAGLLSALLAMLGERDGVGTAVAALVAELVTRDRTPAALQQLISYGAPHHSATMRRSVLNVLALLLHATDDPSEASDAVAPPPHVDVLLEGLLQALGDAELDCRGAAASAVGKVAAASTAATTAVTTMLLPLLVAADQGQRAAAAAALHAVLRARAPAAAWTMLLQSAEALCGGELKTKADDLGSKSPSGNKVMEMLAKHVERWARQCMDDDNRDNPAAAALAEAVVAAVAAAPQQSWRLQLLSATATALVAVPAAAAALLTAVRRLLMPPLVLDHPEDYLLCRLTPLLVLKVRTSKQSAGAAGTGFFAENPRSARLLCGMRWREGSKR
jgi:hypothetical protein